VTKKLTKHGNSLALIIDKPLLDVLGIDATTNLKLSVEGGALIITAASKKTVAKKSLAKKSKKSESIDAVAQQIIKEYEPVFRKLAKT